MPSADIPLTDLLIDTPFAFEQDGVKLIVLRTAHGVYAFDDVCPHAFWPLSAGHFQDGLLECPGHAWEFDVRTGKCRTAPSYSLSPVSILVEEDSVHLTWEIATSARGLAKVATACGKVSATRF